MPPAEEAEEGRPLRRDDPEEEDEKEEEENEEEEADAKELKEGVRGEGPGEAEGEEPSRITSKWGERN
jgi:hypothetical protein